MHQTSSDMSYLQQTMDVTENRTFSALNCSTSTEVDGPSASRVDQLKSADITVNMPSWSPLMRKLEGKFEDIIDKKLNNLMDTIKNQTADFSQMQMRQALKNSSNETTVDNAGMVSLHTWIISYRQIYNFASNFK